MSSHLHPNNAIIPETHHRPFGFPISLSHQGISGVMPSLHKRRQKFTKQPAPRDFLTIALFQSAVAPPMWRDGLSCYRAGTWEVPDDYIGSDDV